MYGVGEYVGGWLRTFVRAYERASKRVYVVPRHHVLKYIAYVIAIIYNSMSL